MRVCEGVFFYAWYCPKGAREVHECVHVRACACARPHCVEVVQGLCVYVSEE